MLIRFIFYGFMGWITEILYSGVYSLSIGDRLLTGETFLWMFPIYGLLVYAERVHDKIRSLAWPIRGMIWLILIWSVEYTTGWLLSVAIGSCPWDYSKSPYSINGFIRLDMGFAWFCAGLGFEKIHDRLDKVIDRYYREDKDANSVLSGEIIVELSRKDL